MTQIVLIGRTGSGKTTLAREVAERIEVPHISSGDIVRSLSESDPDFKKSLELGLFAPEEPVRHEVQERLERAALEKGGWILEGFPRHVAQLALLLKWTKLMPTFIFMDAPVMTCIERLTERNRADDNADSIAQKLKDFQTNTLPVLEILEEADLLYRADAELSIEELASEVERLRT